METKRITCFIAALSSGGAEHQLSILADALAEKGNDVELVTYSDLPDHYSCSEKVKRIRLAEGKKNWMKFITVFFFFLFHKTDCIVSFGYRNNTFALLPLLLRPKIKVLAGERCVLFEKESLYHKLNYKILYKRANYIVPNSYCQGKDIEKRYPHYEKKIVVITNYTDVKQYKPEPLPANETVQIGIFCRYHPQKNYERFAHIVKLLKDRSRVPFHFTWYGNKQTLNHPNQHYLRMKELVAKFIIEDVITLNDHTRDVSLLLPRFDALCLPSLVEGFSNSIGEYICSGRPVLCSDVADNGLMVKDGVNGFLFDPTNEEQMVEGCLRFLSLSAQERNKMGIESRKIAETLFDKEKFVQQYETLIKYDANIS